MGQNTSSAVMQQRSEPHKSLDDFPTPPWATRALCAWLQGPFMAFLNPDSPRHATSTRHLTCREPAANRGHMVRPLSEYFGHVEAADVHDYGTGFAQRDYLFGPDPEPVDWTITNPPFRLAEQFIERALRTSRVGCAFILRSAFLEGQGRFQRLFSVSPPCDILQFSERVVMHKGRLAPEGSTATAYCWIVFSGGERYAGTRFHWIAPCRAALERAGDYPAAEPLPDALADPLAALVDAGDTYRAAGAGL